MTLNIEDIRVRVRGVVSEFLGVNQEELHDESKFDADLNADSLDYVELCWAIEEEFGIDLTITSDGKLIGRNSFALNTVDDVVKHLATMAPALGPKA